MEKITNDFLQYNDEEKSDFLIAMENRVRGAKTPSQCLRFALYELFQFRKDDQAQGFDKFYNAAIDQFIEAVLYSAEILRKKQAGEQVNEKFD